MTNADLEGVVTDREDTPMDVTDDDQTIVESVDDERPSDISARDNTLAFAPTLKKLSETAVETPELFSTNKFKKKMPSKREPICLGLMQSLDPIDQVESWSKP